MSRRALPLVLAVLALLVTVTAPEARRKGPQEPLTDSAAVCPAVPVPAAWGRVVNAYGFAGPGGGMNALVLEAQDGTIRVVEMGVADCGVWLSVVLPRP